MSTTRAVWIFLLVLTALRLALLGATQLSPDEAYYWMWSQRPALSYFSKGPGRRFRHPRRARRFLATTNLGCAFGARCSPPGTSLLLYYFAQRLFSSLAGFWTVVALNVTPIFNLGSLVLTIDPLSIFFWVAAFYTFWLALERSPGFSWWWPLTGLLIGLGFPLQIYQRARADFDSARARARPATARANFAGRIFICSCWFSRLCTIPPIIWNSQHAWITLAHLQSRGSLDSGTGLSSARVAHFSRRTFRDLFAAAFSRAGLGDDRELAARAAKFQGPLSALVRAAGFSPLRDPLAQQSGRAKLGRARFSQPRRSRDFLLAGAGGLARTGARNWTNAAVCSALFMSAVLVGLMVNPVGIERRGRDPSDRLRGWRSAGRGGRQGPERFRKADRPDGFPHRRRTRSRFRACVLFAATSGSKVRVIRPFTSRNRRTW